MKKIIFPYIILSFLLSYTAKENKYVTDYINQESSFYYKEDFFKLVTKGTLVHRDLTQDFLVNVLDIVYMVNIIIDVGNNNYIPTQLELEFGDIAPVSNLDGIINVVDIVALVNIILNQ